MTRLRTRLDENLVCLYLKTVKREEMNRQDLVADRMSTKKAAKFSFHYVLGTWKITIHQQQKLQPHKLFINIFFLSPLHYQSFHFYFSRSLIINAWKNN